MNDGNSYRGIDRFRLIAALLILAIHTSPLSSLSAEGDFILTRIIARIAVPFFMMTSGFFLLSAYRRNADRLRTFVKKTAAIYGVAILLYLPLNLYTGYFGKEHLLPNLLKDLLLDGTLYHLWYLPASILGAVIAWGLVRRLGFGKAALFASLLYLVGLFGDSYYGIAEKIPFLRAMYDSIFEITDYTRNGFFFAPVFFVLGGMIADQPCRFSRKRCLIGFAASLTGLIAEGLLLHKAGIQRHDSMYLLLIPCMFFLFSALTYQRGKRSVLCRTCALTVYIIHPMVIVAVRLFAKLTHTQSLFVDNSIVHFLTVGILSFAFALLIALPVTKRSGKKTDAKDRAWLEINLNNLEHNVAALQGAMPEGCELMAVLKAEGYGHGAYEIATCVNRAGVKAFAVATIDEGIALRGYGIRGEILILGYTAPARAKELHRYDLTQTLIDDAYAALLDRQGYRIKAHIKVDTGMHRLGFDCTDTAAIGRAFAGKHLTVCGIYTHLCVSDSLLPEDAAFTKRQTERFYRLLDDLKKQGIRIPKIHMQSSAGFLNYPELKGHYIRAGIALYGVSGSPDDQTKSKLDLRPVLSLKTRIVHICAVGNGESAGYGRAFVAQRDSRIGILPVGYADGIPRALSCGKGEVLIRGQRVPVVGRVCMDQLAVDLTDIREASVGDLVTLIGRDSEDELTAAEVADRAGSISNELLSRMGRRLKITVCRRGPALKPPSVPS